VGARARWVVNVQKTVLALGIAVILALFLNVAFSIVYERPEYPDQSACYPKYGPMGDTPVPADVQAQCDAELAAYETASQKYSLVVFVFSLVVGVALLAGGVAWASNQPFSWGYMLAGLFQLVFGSAVYWGELSKVLRLVLLAGALVALWFVAKKAGWTK
jgi:hypothetical protein